MANGYMEKILWVNLSQGELKDEALKELGLDAVAKDLRPLEEHPVK